ncbi:MAG TPA: tyrosine-type recombinase/integrase [Acidimicrobiales bacterium]|nr:tyrosine-type recombinase/integrase [Acidimicrobiales bacterium]
MSRRRQFGNIRRLPSGRWQARYKVEEGRSITAPSSFATKAEAARWLAGVETERARGTWVDPHAGRTTVEAYAWAWLRGHARLARRTREIYESQLRLHILPAIDPAVPALGTVALADVTPALVRQWYALLVAHHSPSVAAKAYTRLRQVLGAAVDDELIAKNPCRIDRGGVEHHPEQRFATMAELASLAAAVPDRYRALVLAAGLGGLRQGELFALRWADIDLPGAAITVRRKRLRLASGEVIEDDPKSRAGRRTVALPAVLVAELERHRDRYGAGADDYVFTSEEGLPLERSNFRQRVWQPAARSAGVAGLRFHDLRHSAGTLAARTGATTKELMARLGHASPRAAMIYQHAADDRDRRIAEGLDAMAEEAGLYPPEAANDRDVPLRSGTEVARRKPRRPRR